jgi:hypothetical protein
VHPFLFAQQDAAHIFVLASAWFTGTVSLYIELCHVCIPCVWTSMAMPTCIPPLEMLRIWADRWGGL